MRTFTLELSDRIVQIDAMYDWIWHMTKNYHVQSNSEADIKITTTQADLDFERQKAYAQFELEHRMDEFDPNDDYEDWYLEELAVYRKVAEAMLDYQTFLMHGSTVAVGTDAFLFTAASGTGKTTHTNLWLKHIPGSYMVNGDKPLIHLDENGVYACGTPWAGKEGRNTNCKAKLRTICLLSRGTQNHIEKITFEEALPALIRQTYRPSDIDKFLLTMDLIEQLQQHVTFFRLTCNMEPEAALLSYQAMREA